ncbi:conserved protein of unknown function [Methylorubrum extorquens DM4]|uniref:Uncharacterized protein n=1 Tax=Methylorubrum extorquens (strain DSM 6343 / CIP 106787 / DM4) TaxID=661410 RepID=C7C866_METED|nr:hypothetical protein [Methylorubrum extorquens]CAX21996.1 conserved protein of unknown function [Methylorubrum extorquens DM4]
MSPTAADWDARIDRLTGRLPRRVRDAVVWLRVPSRRPVRLMAALALIAGGMLSFLPILGLWMLPLGFALLSEDIPALKPRLEMAAQASERFLSRFRKS